MFSGLPGLPHADRNQSVCKLLPADDLTVTNNDNDVYSITK
jgi:hypothetical protein